MEVAHDCFNAWTGEWRWPLPQRSWLENRPYLKLMREALYAYQVFKKPEREWKRPEKDYFKWTVSENHANDGN